MKINEKGEIIDHEVVETLIRVDRRMTYTAVNEIITDKKQETIKEYEEFVSMFELMAELSEILRERRYGRGAIDFDFPECKIKLDEKGHPFSIEPYDRNAATKLIEDFMLAANETIAEYYFWQQVPFVYRNHEEPDSDRMKELALFITNFGYHVKVANDQIHPKELQKLLKRIEKTPEEAMISRVTLRSMKRAEYASTCTGHFGLAAKYYCHFTSPIRRYPDLQIHRIIKECLNGKMSEKHREHYRSILPEVTKHCSMTERRADDAERDTEKVKKAEYMRGFIGEEFTGVISGVTNFGVYVELPDTVEGLVHVSNITDDHYIYDEASYSLVGEKTKKTYKLGQTVKIRVEGADKIAGTIDFSMV
jgi:ribonuclease R